MKMIPPGKIKPFGSESPALSPSPPRPSQVIYSQSHSNETSQTSSFGNAAPLDWQDSEKPPNNDILEIDSPGAGQSPSPAMEPPSKQFTPATAPSPTEPESQEIENFLLWPQELPKKKFKDADDII